MDLNACRVCLKNSATISLFAKHEDNTDYSAKIMSIVDVVIKEDDNLPSQICIECTSELETAISFIRKCESSDKTLRRLLEELLMKPIKEEASTELPDAEFHQEMIFSIDNHGPDVEAVKPKRKKKEKLPPIQCVVCGIFQKSNSAMEIHLRTHTGEKPYKCDLCSHKFPAKGSLKRHMENNHSKRERKFTCETCGVSFYTKADIVIHMRRHTGERPFSCAYCSKNFIQVASLTRHMRTHTGDKPYSCSICCRKFSDKTLLRKHATVHSDEKKYTCNLCDKAMKTRDSLRVHLALHRNEKANICNFCSTTFSAKGNLQLHIRRVHSEKSGECEICLKVYSDLPTHMRKHTGEKPFICALCSKAFMSKRSLSHHVLFKHDNKDKYRCSVRGCLKTFPVAAMLEFHLLKQHANHTPHVCEHCARGFYRLSDLSRHLRVAHCDMQYKLDTNKVHSN